MSLKIVIEVPSLDDKLMYGRWKGVQARKEKMKKKKKKTLMIVEKENPVSVKVVSEKISVSERTIRRYLHGNECFTIKKKIIYRKEQYEVTV